MKLRIRTALVAGLALASLAVANTPSFAGAQVTSGRFEVFAAGVGNSAYDNFSGHAHMVRTASEKTIVKVNVTGLAPNTTYGSHVHKQACADGFAGGHYKLNPDGPVAMPNEIWPGFTTDGDGAGDGKATVEYIAGPTAVSVVIHAPGGAKIACADLA